MYEIKTTNSLVGCIREALSQLLEYAYYPNVNNASKLVIVSQNCIDQNSQQYIKRLRETFNIPIYYQRFHIESKALESQLH